MAKLARARQLPAKSLGVLPWQQDFWLLLVEHVLAKRPGPPDLLRLDGFSVPAITQYTATTPELLRSFRKYNSGKPYHRQIRPFGFMVMLQKSDDVEQSTMMRIVAPFNRDPAKAARKAFDRDTGVSVVPGQLKSYAHSLRHYHNHPEAKFLNGDRGDRGPTQRRHISARSIVHIGKEANRLDIQLAAGVDPGAQVEFHAGLAKADRMKAIATAAKRLGPTAIARETGLSRKHIAVVVAGMGIPSESALSRIERALLTLTVRDATQAMRVKEVLAYLGARCEQDGLRQVASCLATSPGSLSRVISGQRTLSASLMKKIERLRTPLK